MSDPDTDSTSDFEPEDEAVAARLDAEAEADIAAGRVIPHERVAEWLTKLARGEKAPPLFDD
jgi:predicted transcriptional regulator